MDEKKHITIKAQWTHATKNELKKNLSTVIDLATNSRHWWEKLYIDEFGKSTACFDDDRFYINKDKFKEGTGGMKSWGTAAILLTTLSIGVALGYAWRMAQGL